MLLEEEQILSFMSNPNFWKGFIVQGSKQEVIKGYFPLINGAPVAQ